jgi:hypothetical protein
VGIFGRSDDERPLDAHQPAPHEQPGGEFLQFLPGYQDPNQQPEGLASPIERADEAFKRGDQFLQIEIPYAEVSAERPSTNSLSDLLSGEGESQ